MGMYLSGKSIEEHKLGITGLGFGVIILCIIYLILYIDSIT